jgi:hypothetical protein
MSFILHKKKRKEIDGVRAKLSKYLGKPYISLVIGKNIVSKLNFTTHDNFNFYYDDEDPRLWMIKKEKEGYSPSGGCSFFFHFQFQVKNFDFQEKDFERRDLKYEIKEKEEAIIIYAH